MGTSMAAVSAHYDELLAELYSWMLGDFSTRVEAARSRVATGGRLVSGYRDLSKEVGLVAR